MPEIWKILEIWKVEITILLLGILIMIYIIFYYDPYYYCNIVGRRIPYKKIEDPPPDYDPVKKIENISYEPKTLAHYFLKNSYALPPPDYDSDNNL